MNLLGNAIQHTPERTSVRLEVSARDGLVVFTVRDEGPGVPATELESIFDIYATRKEGDMRGVGLGLPLSRRLARLLGGDLLAVATAAGGGEFRLELPATCHREDIFIPASRRTQTRVPRFVAMKILVVEDDRKVAGFIEQGLQEEGYVVDVAPDGDEATLLAHVYEYDIILLDIVLPKKNGFQVATELRREGPEHPDPHAHLAGRHGGRGARARCRRGRLPGEAVPVRRAARPDPGAAPPRRRRAARGPPLRSHHAGPAAARRADQRPQLDLTPKEFQLLEYFLLHPEEVVRRTTLLEKVWDMHFDPESNVVDVHVGNLRRKLSEAAGEPLLATVRGVGFSLRRDGRTEASAGNS